MIKTQHIFYCFDLGRGWSYLNSIFINLYNSFNKQIIFFINMYNIHVIQIEQFNNCVELTWW